MAEGGYDPETTNPFDPHEDNDGDSTPLIPHEETEMKRRAPFISRPPPRPRAKTSTSTSGEHETSFIDTPSEKELYTSIREQQREEIESRTKEKFANPSYKKFISDIDEYDRVYFKLLRGNAKRWYLDGDVSKFPKTLRASLGRTHEEVNQEAYNKQKEEEEKQAKKEQELQQARRNLVKNDEKLLDAGERKDNLHRVVKEQEEAREHALSPEDKESYTRRIEENSNKYREVSKELDELRVERDRLEQAERNADEMVQEGERQVETARERVNQRLLSLRDRIKEIFKKHGFTVISVTTAIGVVIGVIVSNLKSGLTKVANGVGNGLKELGAKLGQILPGMVGAITSFLFRTAGEVIGFLAKNAWLLIVGLVVLAVEQFKKKTK